MSKIDTQPLVSIVIPTYGRPSAIKQAIQSVVLQTYQNWELIVVDDNDPSSPERKETEALFNNYESNLNITYIPLPQNRGACSARNTGIEASNGQYVAFLDDDDEWYEHKLEKQIKAMQKSDASVCYCDMYLTYDGRKKYHQHRIVENTHTKLLNRGFGICTSAIVVSLDALRKVNGFDTTLPSMQDYDLLLRLAESYDFIEVQEALLTYKLADDGISCNPKAKAIGHQGIIKKYESLMVSLSLFDGLSRQYESLGDFELRSENRKKAYAAYAKAFKLNATNPRLLVKIVAGLIFGKWFLEGFLSARQKYSSSES